MRGVIAKYSATSLPPVPKNNEKTGYGGIQLEKTSSLFDILDSNLLTKAIESDNPISMEAAGQVFVNCVHLKEQFSDFKTSKFLNSFMLIFRCLDFYYIPLNTQQKERGALCPYQR